MNDYIVYPMIFIIYIIFHMYVYKLVEKTGHVHYKDQPIDLFDAIHKHVPHMDYNTDISVVVFILPLIFNLQNESFYKELFIGLILIFFIRDIFNLATILPQDESCEYSAEFKLSGGCWDKVFSGHFSLCYFLSLMYYKYGIITSIPLIVIANIINALLIITSKSHYTVDVLTAFFVTSLVAQGL